jgi:glucuronoarabinoxylan endo-1,4-beta-xylanase
MKYWPALLFFLILPLVGQGQIVTNVVDSFDPAGTGGNSYSGGQITKVWSNWFGGAFQSLAWDGTSDANDNAGSGSMKITAAFTTSNSANQFEIYDGPNGINPALNGTQYTNFQCDVRFAADSATVTNNGVVTFGYLQFGVISSGFGQDYFGGVNISAANTNWVHVSLPINSVTDTNLAQINDVLIHIYGPYSGSTLVGASTLWVDNIQFSGPGPTTTGSCTVDWKTVYQRIDGFGASSAWNGNWTSTQADMFFSTNSGTGTSFDRHTDFAYNGIGLSLLRSRIAPGGTTVEQTIMQYAQARGAKVWSTPWSPAASFKSANAGGVISVNGGAMVGTPANYQAYASQLAGYVANMKTTYGVNLYAVSVQNEPDVNTTNYESCLWTAQQIHDFVPYLSAALTASNMASTKILLAEDENWQTNLYLPALNDISTATNVGIVACHDYDGSPPSDTPPALATGANPAAARWETEVSLLSDSDSSIANAIYWAGRVHLFMTVASANAWHYWWLVPGNSVGNQGLTDTNGIPAKRMYALGNFSRFVRPNFYRINATNPGDVQVSAYEDPVSANFAIVAINSDLNTITQTFNLTNVAGVSTVTPWITSSNLSLAAQAPVAVTNSSFTYALPAMSVVTFAGQSASNPPPALSLAVAGSRVNVQVTGSQGPSYNLQVSTNLSTWQTLASSNSPVLPFTFSDTNSGGVPGRFYRVQTGP